MSSYTLHTMIMSNTEKSGEAERDITLENNIYNTLKWQVCNLLRNLEINYTWCFCFVIINHHAIELLNYFI